MFLSGKEGDKSRRNRARSSSRTNLTPNFQCADSAGLESEGRLTRSPLDTSTRQLKTEEEGCGMWNEEFLIFGSGKAQSRSLSLQ